MKLLSIILFSLIINLSFAQPQSGDTLTIEGEYIPVEKLARLDVDSAGFTQVYTIHSPEGVIYNSYNQYSISIPTASGIDYFQLPRSGYLLTDSIRRVQVNGKGSEELLLYFEYNDHGGSEFSGYELAGSNIILYDLDRRKILLQYALSDYNTKSTVYFLDSLGNEIFLTEEQREAYLNDKLGDAEPFSQGYTIIESHFKCSYILKKNKLKLECLYSEEQDAANNSEDTDVTPMEYQSLEYKLINDSWILQKKVIHNK